MADATEVRYTQLFIDGEWQDAGTIESLLQANSFAVEFAAAHPVDTGHDVAEVEA